MAPDMPPQTVAPAFGPEPIRERLRLGDAKVLVTSPELYRRKIMPIRDTLPGLEHVLRGGAAALRTTTRSWPRWPARSSSWPKPDQVGDE